VGYYTPVPYEEQQDRIDDRLSRALMRRDKYYVQKKIFEYAKECGCLGG
jgi:hypothetical protein